MKQETQTKEWLYLNGEILPLAEGKISVLDRGFLFADGIYDAIRVYRGKPFALREHLERFQRNAAELFLELPCPLKDLEATCLDLVRRSNLPQSTIYIQLTRGAAKRTHAFSEEIQPTLMAYVQELKLLDRKLREAGVPVISLPDERWNRCDIKSIALLPSILAAYKAKQVGANDAILYGPEGIVYEGASCNVFWVRDGILRTHPLTKKVLPGVTRRKVLEIAKDLQIPIKETGQTIKDLKAADEVFLTSITREVLGVNRIDDKTIGEGEAGPVTWCLYEAFLIKAAEECKIPSCY